MRILKKILALIVALAGISAFAEPWTEASDAFAKFFTTNGNAVFIRENKDNLIILPKSNIRRIRIDEDDVKIVVTEDEKEEDYSFKKGKVAISLGENMNLYINKN